MKTRKRLTYYCIPSSQLGHPGYVIEQFPIPMGEDKHDMIKYVIFEQFDSEAQMRTRVLIHWTQAFQYMLAKWPKYGSVTGVVTDGGRTVWAKSLTAAFDHNYPDGPKGWNHAPDLLRKTCRIVELNGGSGLLHIIGHDQWMAYRNNELFDDLQAQCKVEYKSGQFT